MKNEHLYRETFINNTVRLVAEGGFEKATTRAIANGRKDVENIRFNEANIYRVFGTKENLFAETFNSLDAELIYVIRNNLYLFDSDEDFRTKCQKYFMKIWRFLLGEESKCRYFTRYYYSSYFDAEAKKRHNQRYGELIEKISVGFKPNTDVLPLLHHCITVMLDFSIRVYNGSVEDTDDNAYHIFMVIYASITPYLKKP